jgi:nitroimidazol reductase NimA-like FMN-containing flavoprotein (pyridoxamine 5'-phosphate oxidase superfamily)
MSSDEVNNLLDQENICRIAFKGEEFPYMAPFQYIRIGNTFARARIGLRSPS